MAYITSAIIPDAPPCIDWWITHECALDCDFCYVQRDNGAADAPRTAIVQALTRSRSPAVTVCGGEPLLVPDIRQIVSVLGMEKRLILNTNGEFLRYREDILGFFHTVGVSLDGPDEATHQQMRGKKADFSGTVRAIEYLSTHRPGTLKIGTLVSAVNKHAMLELAARISEWHPRVWRLYECVERGQQPKSAIRHKLQEGEFAKTLETLSKELPLVCVSGVTAEQTEGCFIVDAHGTVLQPYGIGYQTLGSCLDTDIDHIWRTDVCRKSVVLENKDWIGRIAKEELS